MCWVRDIGSTCYLTLEHQAPEPQSWPVHRARSWAIVQGDVRKRVLLRKEPIECQSLQRLGCEENVYCSVYSLFKVIIILKRIMPILIEQLIYTRLCSKLFVRLF